MANPNPTIAAAPAVMQSAHRATFDARYGYQVFTSGNFTFTRDEYFVRVTYPKGTYVSDAGLFLRAMMRDVAWGFFYGWVNFDDVFGTVNHYGSVDVFVGSYNAGYKQAGTDFCERFDANKLYDCFHAMLSDWTNAGFDPFAAPLETGSPYGSKNGNNDSAVNFQRELAERFVGSPGDTELRTDARGFAINRQFTDVPQDEPQVHAEPGFEGQLSAFNLFAYLSRSPVTWNPSIVSVVGQVIVGFGLALLLNRNFPLKGLVTTLLLLPMMLSMPGVCLFGKLLYDPNFGIINYALGLGKLEWLGDPNIALYAVALTDIWMWSPFVMLLSLAGLSAVPKHLYEAASIDRASRIYTFFRITLPLVAPILLIAIIFRTMEAFKTFDLAYVMSGQPTTEVVSIRLYKMAFQEWQTGKSCALAYIVLIMVLCITNVSVNYLNKAKER